jgi:general secretion pathway protein N
VRRLLTWLALALLTVAITVLAFCPAAWIAPMLEAQTAGRLTLGDVQGTIWRGSGFIGAAPSGKDPVTPLLPGRFDWRISPLLLFGQVDLQLNNPSAFAQPLSFTGSWSQWQVSPDAITLPAERLAGLGAPLNTLAPSGQMRLSWGVLQLARQGRKVDVVGAMTLDLSNIASRLSSIKPLGAYQMAIDWRGQQASLTLKTIKGPLLLSGAGALRDGRLQFSGKAEAEAGQQETLANLLNLLGQRRKDGDKTVIALEFK